LRRRNAVVRRRARQPRAPGDRRDRVRQPGAHLQEPEGEELAMGAKKTSQDDLDIIKTKTREELESMALTLLTRTHSLSKELKDNTEKQTELIDARFDGLVQRVLTLARFVYVKPTGCYPIRLQLVDGAGNWE